jgi:RNA polymerase-binding transcription factor DksA
MDATIRRVLASRVERVEHARHLLELGTYGQCEDCGGTIDGDRLEAVPDATLCIGCQRRRERRARASRVHSTIDRSAFQFSAG